MYCKFCGKEIDDNSIYCKYCGGCQNTLNQEVTNNELTIKTGEDSPIRIELSKTNKARKHVRFTSAAIKTAVADGVIRILKVVLWLCLMGCLAFLIDLAGFSIYHLKDIRGLENTPFGESCYDSDYHHSGISYYHEYDSDYYHSECYKRIAEWKYGISKYRTIYNLEYVLFECSVWEENYYYDLYSSLYDADSKVIHDGTPEKYLELATVLENKLKLSEKEIARRKDEAKQKAENYIKGVSQHRTNSFEQELKEDIFAIIGISIFLLFVSVKLIVIIVKWINKNRSKKVANTNSH